MSSTFDYALQAPWVRLINRVLRDYPDAKVRLARFAGQQVRIQSGQFDLRLLMAPDGAVDVAPRTMAAALTAQIPPSLLPRLARNEEAAYREISFEGDADMAHEISFIARNVEWDIEADVSRYTGDIVAHRVVGAARELAAWRHDAADRLGANIREYLTEERPALVPKRDMQEFVEGVDTLRDDAARLEKRIESLRRSNSDA